VIGFLSPLWLLAGLAIAVPLAIHLMRRRTGARVDFPAVRWLARAEREHSRSLRLRNLLLMVLRVAAVLLLALAAARPVARLFGAGLSHAPTALAIVLDNSLSTSAVVNGRPVLEDLKLRASAAASRATGDDRLWLVTADGMATGGSASAIKSAIARTLPLAGAGSVEDAAQRAAALVAASPLAGRGIAIVTDGQATAWSRPLTLGDAGVVLYRPAGPPPADHAVVMSAAEPSRWTPRGAVHARVRAADSVTYRLTLGARTVARGIAAADGDLFVRVAPPERGWIAGTVELEPDELRGDDARHFAVWAGAPPAVRVDPSAGLFARTAAAALVQAQRIADGGAVTIAAADANAALPALLTAPANPVRVGAANRALERLGIPWRLGAVRRGESAVRGIAGVTVTLRYALVRAGGAAAAAPADTAALASGEPWIVRGPGYVLVASPLVPAATDLPLRAAFVPWMADVLTQDLGAAGRAVASAPLARIAAPAGADTLISPSGGRNAIGGDSVTAPGAPGVYWFARAGAIMGALVVNAEPEESDLARLDLRALEGRLHARELLVLDDSTRFAAAAFAASPRRPVGTWLVALALALLVTESVITSAARRAQGA
jgi:hypothetical protein